MELASSMYGSRIGKKRAKEQRFGSSVSYVLTNCGCGVCACVCCALRTIDKEVIVYALPPRMSSNRFTLSLALEMLTISWHLLRAKL